MKRRLERSAFFYYTFQHRGAGALRRRDDLSRRDAENAKIFITGFEGKTEHRGTGARSHFTRRTCSDLSEDAKNAKS